MARGSKLNVLIACEFSGVVRNAFAKLGHYTMSCDLLPTESDLIGDSAHYQGDIKELLEDKRCHWDLMIAHPVCTFLTNAGVRHLHENVTSKNGVRAKIYGKERFKLMELACEFFNYLKNQPIGRICIENPIPHKYARERIGNYSQLIQPWQFGHKETKATCLWLKNLPLLKPTNIVGPPPKNMTIEEKRSWHKIHYMGPSKDRGKLRSVTYQGFADAFAAQWGNLS